MNSINIALIAKRSLAYFKCINNPPSRGSMSLQRDKQDVCSASNYIWCPPRGEGFDWLLPAGGYDVFTQDRGRLDGTTLLFRARKSSTSRQTRVRGVVLHFKSCSFVCGQIAVMDLHLWKKGEVIAHGCRLKALCAFVKISVQCLHEGLRTWFVKYL